jgi:predicted nuclease of predicted toxin-antitoxin system
LKFKIAENLPAEYASILREAGFEAATVADEKLSGAMDAALLGWCRGETRSGWNWLAIVRRGEMTWRGG